MGYNFLSDKPEGIDSFQSQAHTKIVNVIAEIIRKDEIKLIGLEGEWGSGKSNIVKLLEKILSGEEYIFYTYDAWGHQEDLQRRSFLENLTELMQEKSLKKDWKIKLKNLLSRKTEVEEKEVPRLNKELLISIFILYFNNKIINQDFFEIANRIPAEYPKIKKVVELVLNNTIFILGFLILIMFLKFIKKEKNVLSAVLYLYRGKTLNKKLETTISTIEPNVREFKNWMKEISATLELEKKRLIIIYDNIDRLQEDKVKEVWSSIHTFFSENDYNNIFVIIPFSKKHILTAFKGKDNEVNEGIIEKTFPVVYSVTPPVLVDWKNYFNENLETIFPSINEEDKNIIRTLYNKNIEKITPRGIKSFINELKVLNSIHTDIELKYISLFVLIKEKIQSDFPNYFYGEEFPKYRRILGNDTDKKILAIYFGIDEKNAVQVLLEREMIKNLENGDFSKIDEQSKVNGFDEVLQKVITDLYGDGELQGIYRKVLVAIKNQNINNFISNSFFDSFKSEEKTFSFQEYHKILLEKCSQKEKEIIRKLFEIDFYNEDNQEINLKSLCNQLKELEEYLKNKNMNFKDYIKIRKYKPVIFFQLLEEFKQDYKNYGIDFITEELEKYLIENLRSFREKDMENLNILMSEFDFSELKKELTLRVQKDEENAVSKNEYKIFTDFLIKDKKDLSEIEQDFNMEFLCNKVKNFENDNSNAREEKIYVLSLMIAITSIDINKIKYISNYILDYLLEEEIKQIEEILVNYLEIDKLFIMLSSNYPNRNLTKYIIKIIIENKNIKYLDLENIIKNYNKIKTIIPKEKEAEFFELIDKFYSNNLNFDYKNLSIESNISSMLIDSQNYNLNFVEYLKQLYIEYFNKEEKDYYLYSECQTQNYNLLNILDVVIEKSELKLNNFIINDFKRSLLDIIKGKVALSEKNKNILIKIGEKLSIEKMENIINIDIKDEILNLSNLNFDKCKFFSNLFIKTKFFYFNENDKENQSKREDYNRLIKTIIEPHISNKECQEFVINCEELKKGLKILKEYNEGFINKAEKYFQENEEMKKFFNELKGE